MSNQCPVCGALYRGICKCALGNMFCDNGHHWMRCHDHRGKYIINRKIIDKSHSKYVKCDGTCIGSFGTEYDAYKKYNNANKTRGVKLNRNIIKRHLSESV